MKHFIIETLSQYGYAGIIILIILENVFPPIPSELILTLAGFLSDATSLSIPLLILSSTIASTIGALILYFLGYYINNGLLNKICNIRILHINKEKLTNTTLYFKENGYKSVFYSRLVPIIRSLISIPAGIARMNIIVFTILTFLGSLIWNTILILTGNILGENYDIILYVLDKYKLIIILLLTIIIIIKVITKKK